MPARNIYHDTVIRGLEADGWTITDDPLVLSYGGKDLYVDLGAEHLAIGAEREGRKIAVEIQSFLSASPVHDLESAVGQYNIYRTVLAQSQPDRVAYLAVPVRVYEGILSEAFGQLIIRELNLCLIVFDEKEERIVRWIP